MKTRELIKNLKRQTCKVTLFIPGFKYTRLSGYYHYINEYENKKHAATSGYVKLVQFNEFVSLENGFSDIMSHKNGNTITNWHSTDAHLTNNGTVLHYEYTKTYYDETLDEIGKEDATATLKVIQPTKKGAPLRLTDEFVSPNKGKGSCIYTKIDRRRYYLAKRYIQYKLKNTI